jgi:FkbM family methyltransferase
MVLGRELRNSFRFAVRKSLIFFLGLTRIEPGYYVRDKIHAASTIIDCRTGPNADFSQSLIAKYGVTCHGFEPTRKHHSELESIVKKSHGRFFYHPYALAAAKGWRTFFESKENISGSLFPDHINVQNDTVSSYEVESLSLENIFTYLDVPQVDVFKLDIEGAEYEVLRAVPPHVLGRINQLIVEFHDYCVPAFRKQDTLELVRKLKQSGFRSFTHDGKVYLFYRK